LLGLVRHPGGRVDVLIEGRLDGFTICNMRSLFCGGKYLAT
jgi:hypothetical protein